MSRLYMVSKSDPSLFEPPVHVPVGSGVKGVLESHIDIGWRMNWWSAYVDLGNPLSRANFWN